MGDLAKFVDCHVGERIRMRRTELGLTQGDLAAALNLSYQQVQKYETGANRISAGRMYEIAQRLDIDVATLFEGLDRSLPPEPLEHGGRNRSTIELVKNFTQIKDPSVRMAVSGLVKLLAAD